MDALRFLGGRFSVDNATLMKQVKDKPPRPRKPESVQSAFDIWLHRSLHTLFDEVASEPVPEELLRLIEEDRDK